MNTSSTGSTSCPRPVPVPPPAAIPPGGPVPPPRGAALRLALFGLVAVLAVAFGFVLTPAALAGRYLQHFGYAAITLTFAWFVVALVRVAPGAWRALPLFSRGERRRAAAIIAGCTLLAVLTVPYGYKVLYDELVLQNTAWTLHFYREAGTLIHAHWVDGIFTPIGSEGTDGTYLDKRPFFFAFVVSLLHDLTGYRAANAFALNTALMPVVLALFYLYARRLVAAAAALAALVVLGTFSLLAHNATGAGMEMLNLAMLLLTLHLAAYWLAAPDEPRLAALVLAVVLLAETRYESALYVAPVALLVLEGWRRAGRLILPAAAVLGPALLVPYALHNTYLSGSPQLWELREDDAQRFGLKYLANNLAHAWRYFFNVNDLLTNSWWLFGAGFVALGFALVRCLRALPRWRTAPPAPAALAAVGAAVAANLLLLQFYYWGQLDDPIVARLSLPFAVLLVFCLALAVERWTAPRRPVGPVVMLGAVLAAFTTGLVANARDTGLNVLGQELAWEDRVVNARRPGDRLIITNKSVLPWYVEQVAAIQIERARDHAEGVGFHLDQHTFREVLVLQSWRPVGAAGGFQLDPRDRLPAAYVLEPVAERRFGGHLARISRVVAINLPPPAPASPLPARSLTPPGADLSPSALQPISLAPR